MSARATLSTGTEEAARPSGRALRSGATLYERFLSQRREIERHQWLVSEAAGRDVGFEVALLDWVNRHHESWREAVVEGGSEASDMDCPARGEAPRG